MNRFWKSEIKCIDVKNMVDEHFFNKICFVNKKRFLKRRNTALAPNESFSTQVCGSVSISVLKKLYLLLSCAPITFEHTEKLSDINARFMHE